jgi:UDP-glucuronate 4-epimerase
MKQPILVTGAAGFIGSHLAQKLAQAGYRVVGLDNFDDYYSIDIKKENARIIGQEENFEMIKGDIRDASLLHNLFRIYDFQAVMHLAARAGVRPSVENPLVYQEINIMGTLNLLQACRNSNTAKFMFASSSSVYGMNCASPFKEDANVNGPVSPYAASKASAELFCHTYNHLYKLPMVVLRLFTVYGPRQRPEMAIHRFVGQIDKGEEISVFGDGTANRDYTYVEDIVDGFMGALSYPGNDYQIFNLGSNRTINLSYLIQVIEKALNKPARIKYSDRVPGDVPITMADISKAKSLIGYEPRTSIEEGIKRFVRWYLGIKELR